MRQYGGANDRDLEKESEYWWFSLEICGSSKWLVGVRRTGGGGGIYP